MSNFKQENGVTLVELLAVLSLIGIVIILGYTFFFQGGASENKVSTSIALTQDSNVLIRELENQYKDGANKLCLHTSERRITVVDYTINNGNTLLEIVDDCIQNVQANEPLEISLTIENESRKQISLEAAWVNAQPSQLTLVTPGMPENPEDMEWIEMDTITCPDDPDIKLNIKWTSDGLEYCEDYRFIHNLWIVDLVSITGNTIIEIANNLYTDGDIRNRGTSNIIVNHDAIFNNAVDLKGNSNIIIHNNATFHEMVNIGGNGTLEIRGNATFHGPVNGIDSICVDGLVEPEDLNIQTCSN